LTLDVKVWEPSVIGYFQSVGNSYANSIWEELLNVEESIERFVFVMVLIAIDCFG
jgi:Arf-GAP/coiled-coil/ANK repeat/PH domain-containing protein